MPKRQRQSRPHHRPSAIDVFLSAHPEHRTDVESWAADPAMTVQALLDKLAAIGCTASIAAAGRWRGRFGRRLPGRTGSLRRQVINAVMLADDRQLAAVASLLDLS